MAEFCVFGVLFVYIVIISFITCQNYHFGKYVGWSCLLLAKITFWQVCSLVVFVTCQNLILASMFVGRVCYLPKFDFGKYVRWSCLLLAKIYILASMFVGRVCYLPKFTFWQVCSLVFGKYVRWSCLLLAKIYILASMFVGRVCLSVCLSVCLFVCLYGNFTKSQKRLSQSSPNLVTSKHQSMVPASSLDKNVAQITRSRGQKLGQILKSP